MSLPRKLGPAHPDLGPVVSTTDATETVAARFVTEVDHGYLVDAKILAIETAAHDETASYWIKGTFQNDGGTLTQVGSTRTVATEDETTAGWGVAFDVATEDVYGDGVLRSTIRILVTGAAATAINWRVCANVDDIE